MSVEKSINYHTNLVELKGSDYEIVDGEPNVLGWNVKNTKGKKIGEIDDLLFDPTSRKVRYLVVDMEDNNLDLEEERKVLIPIGIAVIYERDDDVIIPDISVDQLSDLPPYTKDSFNSSTEDEIRRVFEGKAATETFTAATPATETTFNRNDFYEHDHFNENKFYGARRTADTSSTLNSAESTVTPGEEIIPVEHTDTTDIATPVKAVNVEGTDYHVPEEYLTDQELKRRLKEEQRRPDLP